MTDQTAFAFDANLLAKVRTFASARREAADRLTPIVARIREASGADFGDMTDTELCDAVLLAFLASGATLPD